MKPEMTFRRSLRMIAKRWWLLALGGVVFAALAFVVAGQKQPHYVATTTLTLNDQTVGPNEFGPGLQLNDALQVQFNRHYAYLYLRYAVNTNDETSLKESSTLDAEVTTRTAFLRQELMEIDDQALDHLVRPNKQLEKYLPAIAAIRRFRPHRLSLKEEELLSATAPNNDWPYELYERLSTRNEAGPFERDLFAFALTGLAGARTRPCWRRRPAARCG